MDLTFANPAALWALLGIPAVLAIHFLQRQNRREVVTTLFLLRQMQRQAEVGNRLERLRASIPLFLQLLAVLIITWLLAAPKWLKRDAVRRVAVVLDSSASMLAFQSETREAVGKLLTGAAGDGANTDLMLLSSDREAPVLYQGINTADLLAAVGKWKPILGQHEFAPSLRQARVMAGEAGAVILITDHVPPAPLPQSATVAAVGRPIANVGWVGVVMEQKDGQWIWRATVRNHGKEAQSREWRATAGGMAAEWRAVTLAPGELRTLTGPFPNAVARAVLELKADAFPLDDHLPILVPEPKVLRVHAPVGRAAGSEQLAKLIAKFEHTEVVNEPGSADVRALIWPPSTALGKGDTAIAFAEAPASRGVPLLRGPIVAEAHPLVEGLNWQSLLAREGMVIPALAGDRTLLWQGGRPLISLRMGQDGARQLFCHFDLPTSNALKLPALAILVHRFLEEVRQGKVGYEAGNYELRQRLDVAHRTGAGAVPVVLKSEMVVGAGVPVGEAEVGGATEVAPERASLLRAPEAPGFFEVSQGAEVLIKGAARFADAREADLSAAESTAELEHITAGQSEALYQAEANPHLWALALLLCLAGSWWWSRER